MSAGEETAWTPTPDKFRDVVGRFASGVTVVTTTVEDRCFGVTASAVSSLSADPPMLLACLNRTSRTGAAIGRAGFFAVNVLSASQEDLARRFARAGVDKFHGITTRPGLLGAPVLSDTLATLECRVASITTAGSHLVFFGAVLHAAGRDGTPLLHFRGSFSRPEFPPPVTSSGHRVDDRRSADRTAV